MQDVIDRKLIHFQGLLTRPQERRIIPRPQPQSPRPTKRQTRQQGHHPSPISRSLDVIISQIELLPRPPRPNHPNFSLRLLSHPHVEREILPRRRNLRTPGPPNTLQRHGCQPREAGATSPSERRRLKPQRERRFPRGKTHPPNQVHRRRRNNQLQARVLEPTRRRLYYRPNMAVQVLQVVFAA